MPTFPQFIYNQLFHTPPRPNCSFEGKTVIVTGSNSGLGKEAARYITELGAEAVILAVRSVEKGNAAKADIEKTTGKTNVINVWQLDMCSYQSVINFADRVQQDLPRLDIAVLNAGVARGIWDVAEGDESTITINVVSTFLLALSLLPKLKDTSIQYNIRPTLTIVSSEVHDWASFPEANAPEGKIFEQLRLKPEKITTEFMNNRYQLSKLLDVLCTRAMTDVKAAQSIPVTINHVNPGLCQSGLSREGDIVYKILEFLLARTSEVGSRTLVHAASLGAESHGQYLSDCRVDVVSEWVTSKFGYQVQSRVWAELSQKLEAIKPGVTANL